MGLSWGARSNFVELNTDKLLSFFVCIFYIYMGLLDHFFHAYIYIISLSNVCGDFI